jgi:radical SAM protein with 4Fe4S-binding SPASM domain
MGCFSLFLTGGEPLLRPDFLDIYDYVISKGILTILFTNATLITPRIADHLAEYPPLFVDISLYGRTKDVYESITGVPGSFERCMRGIELLAERGLPFNLKTPAMVQNQGQLESMAEFAKSLDSDFRFDIMLHPRLHDMDNRYAPYEYSLPLEERVDLELAAPERREAWQSYLEQAVPLSPQDTIYHCGAGLFGFFVDANGHLSMCVLSREPNIDLTKATFQEGWAALTSLRNRVKPKDNGDHCNRCEFVAFCSQCPARSQLEHGLDVSTKRVDWICELTHLRMRKLKMMKGAKG